MKLLLDEHYPPDIAVQLRAAGNDAVSVIERADLRGRHDAELLERATLEHRTILTGNVRDFMPLIQQAAREARIHFGIVFTSRRSMPRSPKTVGAYLVALSALLETHERDDDLVERVLWLQAPKPRT